MSVHAAEAPMMAIVGYRYRLCGVILRMATPMLALMDGSVQQYTY